MKITNIQLAKRVEAWGKRLAPLGVAHWDINYIAVVDAIPVDPGELVSNTAMAAVQCSKDYDQCWWYFTETFLDTCDEEQLDYVIIHEWMHVAMRDMAVVSDRVEKWMPPVYYEDHQEALEHETESLVDRVARTMLYLHTGEKPRFSP